MRQCVTEPQREDTTAAQLCETPKHDAHVLALDAGGIRGLSSLLRLKQLADYVDVDTAPELRDRYAKILKSSSNGKIWKAARATSAAPTYFETIRADGRTFVDGGLNYNNPLQDLSEELWPGRKGQVDMQPLELLSSLMPSMLANADREIQPVSIGTGKSTSTNDAATTTVSSLLATYHDLGIPDCFVRNTTATTTHWQEISSSLTAYQVRPHDFMSIKLLGTGGFSTVDEVVHHETKLRISRKTLKNKDRSAMEELKNEVQVLQKLRHPHIIRFLGAYSKGDKVSILLAPVAETTLALWYVQIPSGRLRPSCSLRLTLHFCLGSMIACQRSPMA